MAPYTANGDKKWKRKREQILMSAGLMLLAASFVLYALRGVSNWYFILAGLLLCGISIAQYGDNK
jgi:glucose dehydrogenase